MRSDVFSCAERTPPPTRELQAEVGTALVHSNDSLAARTRSRLDEPGFVRGDHRLYAITDAELAKDARKMRLDRRLAQVERRTELGVGEAAREQRQDLQLALRQR